MKAIVFDLDDTLFPEREFALSGFRAVDAWLVATRQLAGFYDTVSSFFCQGKREHLFDEAMIELCVGHDEKMIQRMIDVYRTHTPQISLYADARWILHRLKGKMLLGLITDGYAVTQRKKVSALGLETILDVMVFTDDRGRQNWKPCAGPYQEICCRLGVEDIDCVYVGDNPQKDFVTAKKMGWQTVRVRRPDTEHYAVEVPLEKEAAFQINSLYDLITVLNIEQQTPKKKITVKEILAND